MPDTVETPPLALPEQEAFAYLTGKHATRPTIKRLRERGQFPEPFYIGNRAYILVRDLDHLIEQRIAAAPAERERLEARSRLGVARRWSSAQGGT